MTLLAVWPSVEACCHLVLSLYPCAGPASPTVFFQPLDACAGPALLSDRAFNLGKVKFRSKLMFLKQTNIPTTLLRYNFQAVKFTLFSAYNSVVLNTLTELCNHQYDPVLDHFHPKKIP